MNLSSGIDWGAGLEIVRPWLTTGFIGGILALLVKLFVDNRRLRLEETTRDQNFQLEVSADGRTNLQFVIDNLVRDIEAQRETHARCEAELSELRRDFRAQGRQLDGVQRQFINYQLTVARSIPPGSRSPEIEAMMIRLEELAVAPPVELAKDAGNVGEQ